VLCCFLAMGANSFAWQYWLNPMGTIIAFPVLFLLPYFTFSPVFSLLWEKYQTKKTLGGIFAVVLAWIIGIAANRCIPNGVAVRLSQYSEKDFQEISGLIDATYEKGQDDSGELSYGDQSHGSFMEELKESHDIFNLSTFPIRVAKMKITHRSVGTVAYPGATMW